MHLNLYLFRFFASGGSIAKISFCLVYFGFAQKSAPGMPTSRLCQDVVVAKINEAREIRTPNLLIWSQTRCRCAIAPWTLGQLTYNEGIIKHIRQHSSLNALRAYLSLVTAWSVVTLQQQDKRIVIHTYIRISLYASFEKPQIRHLRDSNPCGQSPMDF